MKRSLALLLSVSVEACLPHVDLQVPDADASAEAREQAYEQLKTVETVMPANSSMGGDPVHLLLNNGTKVYHPEDLLYAVNRNSPTAAAVEQYKIHKAKTMPWLKFSGVTFLSAAVLAGVGSIFVVPLVDNVSEKTESLGKGMMIVGGFSFIAAITLGFPVMMVRAGRATNEQLKAFDSFDEDLRRRLNLCRDDKYRVLACAPLGTSLPIPAPMSQPVSAPTIPTPPALIP